MGLIELVLIVLASFAGGSIVTIFVVANNKELARKLLDA